MTSLPQAIEPLQGNYDKLFNPHTLVKHPKKGWQLANKPIGKKDHEKFFTELVASLQEESFANIPNPEGLAKRINTVAQKNPPLLKGLPNPILFKSSCIVFAFLSNFFPTLIICNKQLFCSSEHLYQWTLTTLVDPDNADLHYAQMKGLTPLKMRSYSHSIQESFSSVDGETKVQVMQNVVALKFDQSPPLAQALVKTFPSSLVENTESAFWGGETNHMGKILERVRMAMLEKPEIGKAEAALY